MCLAGSGLPGAATPSKSQSRETRTEGTGGRGGRCRSMSRTRTGFRAAWPSRVIDSREHTVSGIPACFIVGREWKTRQATISRCYSTIRSRTKRSVVKIKLYSTRETGVWERESNFNDYRQVDKVIQIIYHIFLICISKIWFLANFENYKFEKLYKIYF